METFDIEALTAGDVVCCDYPSDMGHVVDALLVKFGYSRKDVIVSETLLSSENYFVSCKQRKEQHKLDYDAHDDTYYLVHVIVPTSTWEITDTGFKNGKTKKTCLCIWAYECGEEVYVERHLMGKCPYIVLQKDIVKKHKFRVDMSFVVVYEGEDRDGDIEAIIKSSLTEQCESVPDVDQIYSDIEWDMTDYEFEVTSENYNFTLRKLKR